MNQTGRILSFTITLFLLSLRLFSQNAAPYKWNVSSKKTGDGKYDLIFSTGGIKGWQLYSTSQSVPDLSITELKFGDSAIGQQDHFTEAGSLLEIKSQVFDNAKVKVYEGSTEWKKEITISGTVPAQLHGELSYNYGRNDEFYTGIFPFNVLLEGGVASTTRIKIQSIDITHPANDCGDEVSENKSMGVIFLLGLLGGFIALLTPCVFPMIPLTVSFFTKKGQSKRKGILNAFIYGFSIFLIYVLLSLPFHIFHASPQVLNNFSTNVWLNLFFFTIFIVFAFSFFGYFEITLPGGLANRASSRSGMDVMGIFFMAFTLAIVSFSCTGPILGSLLASTASQGSWPLTAGLAGFGLALALPFTVFAIFPNWLQSLPKSGGWLNSVKVVLGFLEIAMAIKFLSNADLVKQWGFLKREIFIGSWILVALAIILYLLGKIRFPHDSPVKKFSRTRIGFVTLFIAIAVYLLPGITNSKWANLKLISGFPPPMCYSVYSDPVNCKKGFEPLRDYEAALQRARTENKPILIDFTGWACVNCRRMEEAVWTDPVVDSLMRNEFVVVSLYVDEKRKLPIQQRMVYKGTDGSEKSIVTVGDKWSNFQIENFNAASQPQYAIISTRENALTKTKGYTPAAEKFANWLECGIRAFKDKK
ncbi:MAG TPA: cytochrome c biogenesis protein CcdA [Chitinophagaceae bacterium]|nr:cytochrome c biogenesis protein CcdA [Chitinophagaceae bacterium]